MARLAGCLPGRGPLLQEICANLVYGWPDSGGEVLIIIPGFAGLDLDSEAVLKPNSSHHIG
jgi:hypothetical protein